jgi:NNP family nitrate/nitrite transporter-like MFS transporter
MRLLPLLVFWGLWFLSYSTRTVFAPILPLIEDKLSLSHGEAGGLYTSLSIGYALALMIAGRFASRWGHKWIVVSGFMGIGLVFFGLQWAESYLVFHLLFLLLGIATGTYIPGILPIITEMFDYRNWGKAIGFHDSAASFSILGIPILVAVCLKFFSWERILLILGIASLILPAYFWKVSVEPAVDRSRKTSPYLSLLKKRPIWIMGLLWIFASGSSSGIYSVLPLYLIKERGIDLYLANTLLGISRVGGVFVSILSGYLADRYGYRVILAWSLFTTGLSTIGLSLASTLPLIFTTLFLQATFSLFFFPVGMATISRLTPLSDRAMATGIILAIAVIFGSGVNPLLLGVIADHMSFRVGMFCLGVLTTFSSLGVRFLEEQVQPNPTISAT